MINILHIRESNTLKLVDFNKLAEDQQLVNWLLIFIKNNRKQ